MVRIIIDVVEARVDELAAPGGEADEFTTADGKRVRVQDGPRGKRLRETEDAVFKITWLTAPGTPVFLAALVSMLLLRLSPVQVGKVFRKTFWQMRIPIPTIGPGVSPSPKPTKPVTKTTPIRKPTSENKLRVAVVGDSLAQGLGVYMERQFRPTQVRVTQQGRISTGLARLDYFDWLSAMEEIEDGYRPDLVIVMIGDNDNQSLQSPGGATVAEIGSFEWPQGYEDRVEQMTRTATE